MHLLIMSANVCGFMEDIQMMIISELKLMRVYEVL